MRSSAMAVFFVGLGLPLAAQAASTSDVCKSVSACVLGENSTGIGVNGTSGTSFGIEGATTASGYGTSTARAGVFGKDSTSNVREIYNTGVAGTSTYGYGGYFTSTNGVGVYVAGNLEVYTQSALNPLANGNYTAINASAAAYTYEAAAEGNVFQGNGCYITPDNETNPYCGETSYIDSIGNAYFNSVSFASGNYIDTKRADGSKVVSFGARSASPTIEDFGSATLRNGVARVSLDKTFASTISPGYMVFVTPHGDSNSLYTQNSANGFVVRESKGGRSTLSFDYRVVAKPLDAKAVHLPVAGRHDQVGATRLLPKDVGLQRFR